MKMRDDIYLPQTNIKYKIVKLVLLWSFYRKNYFRKNFISFSQKEKRAYSLHQGKGGTLVYEGFHYWMTIVDFLFFSMNSKQKNLGEHFSEILFCRHSLIPFLDELYEFGIIFYYLIGEFVVFRSNLLA